MYLITSKHGAGKLEQHGNRRRETFHSASVSLTDRPIDRETDKRADYKHTIYEDQRNQSENDLTQIT